MVSHRFLELLAARGAKEAHPLQPSFEVTLVGEEPRLAYDRVGLSTFFDGRTPDEMTLPAAGQYEAAGFAVRLNARVTGLDRQRRVVVVQGERRIPGDRLRPAGAGDGLVRLRAADPGTRRRRLLRLPDDRGPGSDPRLVGDAPGRRRRGDRRRAARARGGLRARQAGDEGPRHRVRAAADGAAARRDRRRRAAPPDRRARRRRPHRDVDQGDPRRRRTGACARCGSRTATSWTSICWSSRPASGRATSWRAPPGCRSASAAASSSTSAAAPRTPRSTRSASAPRTRGAATDWSRPATRWRARPSRRSAAPARLEPTSRPTAGTPWTPSSPAST